MLESIQDLTTNLVCKAERSFLRCLEGGCSVPIGVHSTVDTSESVMSIDLYGNLASLDGAKMIDGRASCQIPLEASPEEREAKAEDLGVRVALHLLDQGAKAVMEEIQTPK